MKREQYNKAKDIIDVLDRIDRVLSTKTIIHNHKTTHEHTFKNGISSVDLCELAQIDVYEGFLNLLYEKKIELEKKLNEL